MKCNMSGMVGVNAIGRSGGLVMMWKEEILLNLLRYSKNHIDMDVTDQQADYGKVVDVWMLPMNAGLMQKLQRVKGRLANWGKERFGSLQGQIDLLRTDLQRIQELPPSDDLLLEEKEMKNIMDELLRNEETYWMQRSRVNWLREGDRNTAFFHGHASFRRKKN
ncbi:hypothetical protein PTKIN_Ptkin01aG0143100 [Pterospermum kingtungense]